MKMINISKTVTAAALLLSILFISGACSQERSGQSSDGNDQAGLSAFELEHGIGPVTEPVELGPINAEQVEKGRNIYEMKCQMCHNMEGRMVGPPLGDVTERRSAEFIMNFILNPSGMTQKHPAGQELLREYMAPMPFQNVSEDEARAIVEFFRDYRQQN